MIERKYRSLYDTVYDILRAIIEQREARVTRVCRMANLPYDRCMSLIKMLENYGLLYMKKENKTRLRLVLTENGYVFIGLYEGIQRILPLRSIPTSGRLLGGLYG